jgi:hypothetical protein
VQITLRELTVDFNRLDPWQLLHDWRWLIGSSKQPVLLSAIGDAFVRDLDDGSIHLLDTAAGACAPVAPDDDTFRLRLKDARWVTDHLAVEVIADFLANGLKLEEGQIFSWKRPPVLGGEYELSNVEITDIAVHFSTTGQIHRQVRDLPLGAPITEVRLRSTGD